MYDTPRPVDRTSGTHWSGNPLAGRTPADRPTGVASVAAHATQPGQQPPTVPDGRHRYDASAQLRSQRPPDTWGLREPGRDASFAYVHADTVIRRHSDHSGWHWLLLLPIVASLLSPYYNRMEPTLGGMPFFYWFPLSLNLVAGACMLTVHLATKRGR